MSDVMISYSRRDGDFVRRLHAALEKSGRDVWVDWQDIPLSADWWSEIKEAIEKADTFVFVISPDSISSAVCNLEIAHARRNNKRLVPVVYRETETDEALESLAQKPLDDNTRRALEGREMIEVGRENWNAVARHNWLYFYDDSRFESSVERLVNVIETDLEHVRSHTRLLVRATEWDQFDRESSYLLTGNEINEAESWLSRGVNKNPAPTTLHAEYISASRRAANRRQRRWLTLVSVGLVVSVLLAILSSVLYFDARVARRAAEDARLLAERRAEESRSLLWANSALNAVENNDTLLALPLALASVSNIENPPALAQQAMAQAAYAPGARRLLESTDVPRGAINGVGISANGSHVAGGTASGAIVVWDAQTGDITALIERLALPVTSVSLNAEGTALVAGGLDGSLILHNTESDAEPPTFDGHNAVINTVAFGPSGTTVLSGSADDSLILWDATTGTMLQRMTGHRDDVNSVAYNADGSQFLSGSSDDTMILWDAETGEMVESYRDRAADVLAVTFGPDDRTAYSGSRDGSIVAWDLESGRVLQRLGESGNGHAAQVNGLAVTADGAVLLSASDDETIILWNLSTGTILRRFEAHDDAVNSVALTANGRTAVSGSDDGSAFLWDISNDAVQQVFEQQGSEILSAAYNESGDRVVVSSRDNRLTLWDTTNGALIRTFESTSGHSSAPLSVDFRAGRVASGDSDGLILVWDTETGNISQRFVGHNDAVNVVAFNADGTRLLAGDDENQLILWSLETGQPLVTLNEGGHTRRVLSAAFSADETRALSGGADRNMVLWNLETGEAMRIFEGHARRVLTVAFGPNNRAYSGSDDDTLIIWDLETGTAQQTISAVSDIIDQSIASVDFNEDRTRALVGLTDGTLGLWDVPNAQKLATLLLDTDATGSDSAIVTATFGPDDSVAIAGARDGHFGVVRTFDLSTLVEWTNANRYIRDLSCTERDIFGIEPACAPEGTDVTPTPQTETS